MTNEITIAPVSILVEGKTKVERQTSVVRVASATALTACLNLKGKVGNAIRESGARSGLSDVVAAACNSKLNVRQKRLRKLSPQARFRRLPNGA